MREPLRLRLFFQRLGFRSFKQHILKPLPNPQRSRIGQQHQRQYLLHELLSLVHHPLQAQQTLQVPKTLLDFHPLAIIARRLPGSRSVMSHSRLGLLQGPLSQKIHWRLSLVVMLAIDALFTPLNVQHFSI